MISRRNIRVKVMQCIYASEAENGAISEKNAVNLLNKYLDNASDLFTFSIFLLTEVARYAETHARNRASKHLPTAEDLNVNVKIAGNTILWQILESKSFQAAVKNGKFETLIDQEIVKKIYLQLAESEIYQTYIQEESREKKTEKELLSFIFTDLIMANEDVNEYLEELFVQWDDDAEMIYQMVLNFLSKPGSLDVKEVIGQEKTHYANSLLKTTLQKKDFTLEMIKPKLKNWDADRIAQLDMIMIRMGICEFLYFETIPTKVTINEYIDIAKSYSTQQSGQFVNGILDSIHKDLQAEGKLKKIDFKKQA
ncbi:MAG: transcription antitermination factor NusB [Bacteroidota bacterium]|jgi:N utilization substance protein B